MTIETTAHLNYHGQAREALEFYASVFGGQVVAFTHAQVQDSSHPADDELLAWGEVRTSTGFRVMAYDVRQDQQYDAGERAFFVSVRGDDADELTGYWHALREGATIEADLGPAPWAPLYGMLRDRFGVTWVLDAPAPYAG